jgi:hypothetical protein
MCVFPKAPKVTAPAATAAPAPPPPAPVRGPEQTSPVPASVAKRRADPRSGDGIAVFRKDLLLPGATKGLNY